MHFILFFNLFAIITSEGPNLIMTEKKDIFTEVN